jgi:hypothetical protein
MNRRRAVSGRLATCLGSASGTKCFIKCYTECYTYLGLPNSAFVRNVMAYRRLHAHRRAATWREASVHSDRGFY